MNNPDGTDFEEFGYDANGNQTSRRTRSGAVITQTFDLLNRVTTHDVPANGTVSARHVATAYDQGDRITSVQRRHHPNYGDSALIDIPRL